MNHQKNEPFSNDQLNNDQIARRKLLQVAAYVPPAILGVMIAGNKVAEAGQAGIGAAKKCKSGIITVSAGGSACCPCVPGDPKYNPTTCSQKRCQLGHCPSCGQMVFKNKGQCTSAAKKTPCACTCVQVGAGKNSFWQMTGC
jgi:hypothetical protein